MVPYAGGSKAYDISSVIDRKRKEIFMRGFAQFLALGMAQVGTQALVKGSHDFFMLSLVALQQELLEAWNQQLVPTMFQYNLFPGLTGLPVLRWNAPGKVDVQAVLQAYGQGVQSEVITPTREDEERVRELLDFPDLPPDVGEDVRGGGSVQVPAEVPAI
jgi:hypothetical protein